VTIADDDTATLSPIYFKARPAISVETSVTNGSGTSTPTSMTGIAVGATVESDIWNRLREVTAVDVTTFTVAPTSSITDSSADLRIGNASEGWLYLLMKDYNFLQEYAPIETATGTPKYYSFYNDAQDDTPSNAGTFAFAPFSSGAFSYEILYFFEPASLVTVDAASADTKTWLSTHGSNALLYACLVESYTFMKGEADLMQAYDMKFKEALQTLVMVEQGNYRTTYRNRGMRAA
jgi:hypothetical protein